VTGKPVSTASRVAPGARFAAPGPRGAGVCWAALTLAGCGNRRGTARRWRRSPCRSAARRFVSGILAQRYNLSWARKMNPPLNWSGAPGGPPRASRLLSMTPRHRSRPTIYWLVFRHQSPGRPTSQGGRSTHPARARAGPTAQVSPAYDRPPAPHGSPPRVTGLPFYALNTTLKLPTGAAAAVRMDRGSRAATIGGGGRIVVTGKPVII